MLWPPASDAVAYATRLCDTVAVGACAMADAIRGSWAGNAELLGALRMAHCIPRTPQVGHPAHVQPGDPCGFGWVAQDRANMKD